MNRVVIGITGHRMLSAEQKQKVEPVLKRAIENIMFVSNEEMKKVRFSAISPIAEGADTIFAHAARSLNIPVHIILPFERSAYLKSFSSDHARNEFELIYNEIPEENRHTLSTLSAHEIDALSTDDYNHLFMNVGRKVADEAHYLITIWDEKEAKGKGGTGDIVRYAIDNKKNVLIINPDDVHPDINFINPEAHADKKRGIIDPHETNHLASYINNKQRIYDLNAVKHNKKYRNTWTIAFVTGLIEVLAFSLIVSFFQKMVNVHYLLASIEFFSVVFIIVMIVFGHAKKHHRLYVHFRIVSERLRIKNYFSKLGMRIYHIKVSPIYASLKEKPEYDILDNTIRLINLSAWSYLSFEKKKHYLETELITDQAKYHHRKMEKFEKKAMQYQKVRAGLFLLFICAVILHYLNVSWEFYTHHLLIHSEVFEEFVIFVSIFVPATVAACEALKYLYEWEKIISLSHSMANYFKEKSKELENTHTEHDLEVFLNEINKDMLTENLDWEKYMHDKNEMPT